MPLSPPLHGRGIESSQFDKKARINLILIVGASLGFAAFIAKRRKNPRVRLKPLKIGGRGSERSHTCYISSS